ncbi:MAG: hypothetical protein ACO1SX_17390, partial [Actinomycetota bacterium]
MDARHRFLCPECLQFSEPADACGACGEECEAHVAGSGGGYVNDCRHCGAALLPRHREGAVGLLVYCRRCRATASRRPHLLRRVCVIGVPGSSDLSHFLRLASPDCTVIETASGVRLDDGSWLTYVLNFGALSGSLRAREHAARQLNAVWLGGEEVRPLAIGEQLDGFLRSTGLSAGARWWLPIYFGCSREALQREVLNVVRGRFSNPYQLDFGVAAETLIERLTTQSAPGTGSKPLRSQAVLDWADWEALREVRDPYGVPLLHRDGWLRQPGGPTIRLYNQEELRANHYACGPELAALEAIWLSGKGDWTETVHQIDRLLEFAGLSPRQQARIVVCIEEDRPSPLLRDALQARFRIVRSAIPAEEFLWHGCGARPSALFAGPTHVLATCLPDDFEALFREMGLLQRERLSTHWAVEETGDRTSHVVDLSASIRLPGDPGATPRPGDVQALWLGEVLPEPLVLAEKLDGLLRSAWGSEQRRHRLAVCLWTATPVPALRNLLKTRIGAVRYGTTARQFLEHRAGARD